MPENEEDGGDGELKDDGLLRYCQKWVNVTYLFKRVATHEMLGKLEERHKQEMKAYASKVVSFFFLFFLFLLKTFLPFSQLLDDLGDQEEQSQR